MADNSVTKLVLNEYETACEELRWSVMIALGALQAAEGRYPGAKLVREALYTSFERWRQAEPAYREINERPPS